LVDCFEPSAWFYSLRIVLISGDENHRR